MSLNITNTSSINYSNSDSDSDSDSDYSVLSDVNNDDTINPSQFMLGTENDDNYEEDDTDYTVPSHNKKYQTGQNNDVDDVDDDEDDDYMPLNEDDDVDSVEEEESNDIADESEEEEEDEDEDKYFKKINYALNQEDYLEKYHPECKAVNYQEVDCMLTIIRDIDNNIIDPLHKTDPILTKYEKTRILGLRTLQLDNGAAPYIQLTENIIDGYLIAEMELREKKLPFIVKRPLPNGGFEYWRLSDLEDIRV